MSISISAPSPLQKAHDLTISYLKTLALLDPSKDEFLKLYKETCQFFSENLNKETKV